MPTATYGPGSAPPTLGYGQTGAAPIDAVNQWMRAQPWYQQLLASWGQSPNNVHLNDSQKQQVIKAAQAHGVVVDEGHDGQDVDDSGNFEAKGHGLRNTLIVAGLAAAAIASAGALLPAEATAAAGTGATVAGVEGGAYGLSDAALAALGTGAGTTAASAAGAGAAFDAAGNFIGPSTVSSVAAPSAAATYGPAAATGLSVTDALKYGLPTAGNIVGSLIQANAAGNASAAQQQYLEEALAYQKEQDAYNRATTAAHYATYSGNIAPYVATGNAASGRMSSLLGLPTPAASATIAPTPSTTTAPSATPSISPTTTAPFTTQPQAPSSTVVPASNGPEPTVMLQAPDGSTKAVPQSQVSYYLGKGAKSIGAAA